MSAHALAVEQSAQAETTRANLSEILGQAAVWTVTNAQRQFLKAREAVIKNKSASALDDRKAASVAARHLAEHLMFALQVEADPEAVVEEFIGLSREWTVTPAKVAAFAVENGISNEQAREALAITMARAQLSSINNRAALQSLYEGWLSDLEPQPRPSDEANAILERTVIQSYKRAGEWLRRDEGILIEGAAADLGIMLPKWADVLPKAGEQLAKARMQIAAAVDNANDAKSKALLEAARQMEAQDW